MVQKIDIPLKYKRVLGVEKTPRDKCARAWAMQGWVTSWVVGQGGEKNSKVKGAQVRAV